MECWCWARCSLCDDQPPTGCWTSNSTYYSLNLEHLRGGGNLGFSVGTKLRANIIAAVLSPTHMRTSSPLVLFVCEFVDLGFLWLLFHAVLTLHWVSQLTPGAASSIEYHDAISRKSTRDTCQAVSKYVRCTRPSFFSKTTTSRTREHRQMHQQQAEAEPFDESKHGGGSAANCLLASNDTTHHL